MTRNLYSVREHFREKALQRQADQWIAVHSPIHPGKLHALGLMHFHWGGCEYELTALFASIAKWPEREIWIMLHDQGDMAIIEKLKAFMSLRGLTNAEIELINNALMAYDVCRVNRNQLTHFSISLAGPGRDDDHLRLARKSKKPSEMFGGPLPDDLWSLRRVANDIRKLRGHLRSLWIHFAFSKRQAAQPLPDKFTLPQRLWKPDPPTTARSPRRHRSSPP